MLNANKGYVGYSRSARSQEAIESFEIPVAMISKSLIEDFLNQYEDDFDEAKLSFLKKVSVLKWKFVAKERTTPSSWHHTGSYFNQTNHYSLHTLADQILEMKDRLDEEYESYQNSKKKEKEKKNFQYGVIKVQVWGGTRNHPQIIGYEEAAGIIIGDWLFYKYNHKSTGYIYKFKTNANKVEWLKRYDSYKDLVKNHKEYVNTKIVFNSLIKEKGLK